VQVAFGVTEDEGDVTFAVYRDGARIAEGLPGTTTTFTDPDSADHAARTACYTVEAVFVKSGNASQHARPVCFWGTDRLQFFDAQAFEAQGGALVHNHGRWHYENWGDPGHTLTVHDVVPTYTGRHLVQVLAGNGAGDFSTGITCGVKAVEVWDGSELAGRGVLVMPQLATWNDWRDSSFVPVDLVAGTPYRIVIREDESSYNMSDLAHFATYVGTGGASGRFNRVNIAEVKLAFVGAP
jgi:hypothetical protein